MAKQLQNNEQLMIALATSRTIREASNLTGVSESVIYRRLANPVFKAEYEEYRKKLLDKSATAMSTYLTDAVNTLGQLINDKDTPPQIKLMASDTIIKNAIKLDEHIQIVKDIEAIKRVVFDE